jgi:hypothetical protein
MSFSSYEVYTKFRFMLLNYGKYLRPIILAANIEMQVYRSHLSITLCINACCLRMAHTTNNSIKNCSVRMPIFETAK